MPLVPAYRNRYQVVIKSTSKELQNYDIFRKGERSGFYAKVSLSNKVSLIQRTAIPRLYVLCNSLRCQETIVHTFPLSAKQD
jgi:hypothetical protein